MKFNPLEDLDFDAAHQIIKSIVQSGGCIILSKHAQARMDERNYSMHDVQYILLNGNLTKKEFNEKTGNWVYTVRGDDLEGDEGGVVTALVSSTSSVIVTVLA